jgi:hypothetical protein
LLRLKFGRSAPINFTILKPSSPSTKSDEYKGQAVELAGWGAKVRNGAVSSTLKRITVRVFSMRYS